MLFIDLNKLKVIKKFNFLNYKCFIKLNKEDSMIKNKAILETLERKKQEVSCDNCKHCNLGAYHSGKWYCRKRSVFDDDEAGIEKCFERK